MSASKFHMYCLPSSLRTLVLFRNFTSVILRLSHGYVTQAGDDLLVDLAHVANSQLSVATGPGLNYVDLFPLSKSLALPSMPEDTDTLIVKYIPSWFPGAGFKRRAKKYAAVLHDLVVIPHDYVKAQLVSHLVSRVEACSVGFLEAAGIALPSLSSRIMSMPDLTEELEDSVKWATATMYQGVPAIMIPRPS